MKTTFSVVPPGGGAQEQRFDVDLSAVPSPGDCVKIVTGAGTFDYLVRRRVFYLNKLGAENPKYSEKKVVLEVEAALDETSCPEHRQACARYAQNGKQPTTLVPSGPG